MYYLWDAVLSYAAFLKEYPYMWRQLGAVVLMDHFYIVQDVWSWLTLDNVSPGRPIDRMPASVSNCGNAQDFMASVTGCRAQCARHGNMNSNWGVCA